MVFAIRQWDGCTRSGGTINRCVGRHIHKWMHAFMHQPRFALIDRSDDAIHIDKWMHAFMHQPIFALAELPPSDGHLSRSVTWAPRSAASREAVGWWVGRWVGDEMVRESGRAGECGCGIESCSVCLSVSQRLACKPGEPPANDDHVGAGAAVVAAGLVCHGRGCSGEDEEQK